jgi:phosphohistidine phosphatase
MKLYLVQHAEAKSKEEDPDRSLTKEGQRNAKAVAVLAAKLGLGVMQVRHSGKTRAEQTATILAEEVHPRQGILARTDMGPLDDVAPVAAELTESGESVMLVGHLPFMERLAGQLVVQDPERPVVSFRNASIVCLTKNEEHWQVSWILTPEMALASSE